MKAELITFEPAGLNNRSDPVDLLPIEMVSANNVDLRKGKSARRRRGGSLVLAGKFFSFWGSKTTTYVGKDTAGVFTLNEFNSDFTLTELASLTVGSPLAFEQVNATTVVSNGVDLGFIEGGIYYAPVVPTATHMRATVAGEHLSEQNGRLLIGRGSSIYYTITHDLETMDERNCQIPLPNNLTMLVALKSGVWVSYHGMVAFLRGADPAEYSFEEKVAATAVRGTAIRTEASLFQKDLTGSAAIFLTEKGACLGTEQGNLIEMTEEQISIGIGLFGASMVREADGYVHFVGSVQEAGTADNSYTPKNIAVNAWLAATTLPLITSQT